MSEDKLKLSISKMVFTMSFCVSFLAFEIWFQYDEVSVLMFARDVFFELPLEMARWILSNSSIKTFIYGIFVIFSLLVASAASMLVPKKYLQ